MVISNNFNGFKGSFDGLICVLILDVNDQLCLVDVYCDLIIVYKNGLLLCICDVVSVEDDVENVCLVVWVNNLLVVVLNIQCQLGVNVIEVVDWIKVLLLQL